MKDFGICIGGTSNFHESRSDAFVDKVEAALSEPENKPLHPWERALLSPVRNTPEIRERVYEDLKELQSHNKNYKADLEKANQMLTAAGFPIKFEIVEPSCDAVNTEVNQYFENKNPFSSTSLQNDWDTLAKLFDPKPIIFKTWDIDEHKRSALEHCPDGR